ncbi:DUF4180 domain-containing protein [Georgenia sp. MJ206]|uniref:DUF4180 domain-containing protein n=1 Tax=Georgenia wangjunii TaxID=3117730 RepID=UPI002F265A46
MRTEEIAGTVVLHVPAQGASISSSQDALDLIGEAWSVSATVIAVPAGRFDPAFFDLRTRLAGEFLQKLVNYRLSLAVVGDVSGHVAASDALRDFVHESNRGGHVWFLDDDDALVGRVTGRRR